jgi:Mn2+/Fe2+ NRAMP family transporter
MFAGGTRIVAKSIGLKNKWTNEGSLKRFFVIIITTILPVLLYVWIGEPVQLLKIAGFIEAAHIPVLVILILILNYKKLPPELRPSLFTRIMTGIAGLFFFAFALVYALQLTGIIQLN